VLVSLKMMDDSMEISSEHGHNIRDEDIDIDIDLTTGHGDEDYILEDALPHQTVDDEFLFEAPQAPGNDDLMVDEDGDNEAYHMNEVDPDLLPDNSNQNMIAEIDTVSFMTANDHSPYQEQHDVLDAGHVQAASVRETEVAEGHKDAPNGYTANAHVDPQTHEEPATHEDEGDIETVNTAETGVENVTALPTNNIHSPSPSTHNNSPKVPAFSEHPKSPSTSLPKPAEESQDRIVGGDQLGTAVPQEYDAGLQVASEESYPTDDLGAHPVPEILVLYQETEYGLFSTSELDDPDSFFLTDTSILDKPISSFLKAMRDVIHEDLSNDDELCLSIGDMGIEVEEVSFSASYS
jgi:hypothetical protein